MGSIDRKLFYDSIRLHLFGGSLGARQVEGMEAILGYWEAHHGGDDRRWLAYILATAFHETDKAMQPVRERGTAAYFDRRYGPPGAVAEALANTEPGDGARFCGRGFVQLTGRRNYASWGKRLGLDLLADPDACLDLPTSARILVDGAIEGAFTGKKLGDFFHGVTAEWDNARRVINGTDRAQLVAAYARNFCAALGHSR